MNDEQATRPTLRPGQVWRTREGKEVRLREKYFLKYPFAGSNDTTYTPSGFVYENGSQDPHDLIELISDAPTTSDPVPPAEPWPLPRLFAAPIRRTFTPSGRMVLDAIADDGTAWAAWIDSESEPRALRWYQIDPLPQPEAE